LIPYTQRNREQFFVGGSLPATNNYTILSTYSKVCGDVVCGILSMITSSDNPFNEKGETEASNRHVQIITSCELVILFLIAIPSTGKYILGLSQRTGESIRRRAKGGRQKAED
jgi:hypothetical protein